MTITDIVTSIDERLTEAKAEIEQLEGARTALTNGAAYAAAPTSPRSVRKTRRTAHEIVPAGKLVALLTGSAGKSTAELAKATHGKPDQILALLRELETADRIRRTGVRRSTRWHLITDEDRIVARAAEIAAQSGRVGKRSR